MTRYLLLALGVGLVLWFSYRSKRRQFLDGPNRTAHLKEWDASEPVIRKLALPDVKALKAQRVQPEVSQPSHVTEFRKRRARR